MVFTKTSKVKSKFDLSGLAAAFKNVIKQNFSKASILAFLKKQITKNLLKRLAITGGIKAWLVAFVIGELIEASDEYIIEPLLLKLGYKKEVYKGSRIYRRIENAQDVDEWRDSVRDA